MKTLKLAVVTSILIGATSTFIGVAAYADPASDLEACNAIENELERLACFDAAYDQIKEAERGAEEAAKPKPANKPEKPAKPAKSKKPAESEKPSDSHVGYGKDGKINQVTSSVTDISKGPFGKVTVTLQNGQKWRQTQGGRVRAKTGDLVTIRSGALGSYFMKVGKSANVRAKRIDKAQDKTLASDVAKAKSQNKSASDKKQGEKNFGKKPATRDEPKIFTATVKAVLVGPLDKFIVTLENGQVWRQTEGRLKVREGDKVTIKRGALGGHFLRVGNKGRSVRVKRSD